MLIKLKNELARKREAYIARGVLPDPARPGSLKDAIKLVGTCEDMCPEYEQLEREVQKELDKLEVFPGTTKANPATAVKIYRRPAAGRELPLPEEIRPARVLQKTLDYLFHTLLPREPSDARFAAVQPFLWNRTRAVRQDFIVQSDTGLVSIACHERIARYHILCLHWKGGPGAEAWSEQQELEQLRKTLRSLIEFYDDQHLLGHTCPNEPEFRAYNLLLHARDPEALREVELLPGLVFRAAPIQLVIELRGLAQRSNLAEKRGNPVNTEATQNFFSQFFARLQADGVPYLVACLAENMFPGVRIGAVKTLSRAYIAQHMGLPIAFLTQTLGMDTNAACLAFLQELGVEMGGEGHDQVAKINRTTVLEENKPWVATFCQWVEDKRANRSCQAIIDGVTEEQGAPVLKPRPEPVSRAPLVPAVSVQSVARTPHPASVPAIPTPSVRAPTPKPEPIPKKKRKPSPPPPTVPVAAPPPARRPRVSTQVVEGLGRALCHEALDALVETAAHQAYATERHARARAQRAALVDEWASQLSDKLVTRPVHVAVLSAARRALAQEYARRHAVRRALHQWRRALAAARDRGVQAARLREIRARLQSLHVPPADSPKKRARMHPPTSTRGTGSDQQTQQTYRAAVQQRNRLWRRGTFAQALVAHVTALSEDHIPPPDAHAAVVLSTPAALSASGQWLQSKLALDSGTTTYDVLGATLTVTKQWDANPALVLFACSQQAREDTARLQQMQARVETCADAPRLMVVAWARTEVHALCKALDRRIWHEIRVLLLDDASRDADALFEHTLTQLLPSIAWYEEQSEAAPGIEPLYGIWRTAIATLERMALQADPKTAAHGFALATSLTNLFLRQVAAACDEDVPSFRLAMPAERPAENAPCTLLELAVAQLDALAWLDSSALDLLRTQLVQPPKGTYIDLTQPFL